QDTAARRRHGYCDFSIKARPVSARSASARTNPMPRVTTRGALIVALMLLMPGVALAQAWPTRSIRLVVTSAAGAGVTDIMARLVSPPLATALGQQIVIDNRPGAGGNLGA